jgi:hypothetical protein
MAAIRVLGFDGLIPRASPTLMGDQFAQVASNVKLYAKELRFWRGPVAVQDQPPPAAYKTLYRLFHSTGATAFLVWLNEVDVAVSPVADTTGETRIYYTGDGAPKKTNWAMATGGAQPYPSAFMDMGVPRPTGAPGLTLVTDGTGTLETRSYVYTLVQQFGAIQAEGAPSPPSTIDVHPLGSTVRIDGFTGWPDSAQQNVRAIRIYRTVVGVSTVSYQFVTELPHVPGGSGEFYNDSLTVAQLGEVISSTSFVGPPVDLAGLIALPSGALAGFVGNTVYFSEPYFPHAWPVAYAITIPVMKIVGLGAVGSSVAVMTGTTPFFIHGGIPGQMYVEKVPLEEPCVAKPTIATDEDGIVYASPNGLVGLSPSNRGLMTTGLFTADEWRPLIPSTMVAEVLQGRYFGVFPNENPSRALILSKNDPPALSFMNLPALALHTDARNGILFYVHDLDHKIYQLDADEITPLNYEWKSKRFFHDQAVTFSLMRVDADYGQIADEAAYEAAYAAAVAANSGLFAQDLQGANDATAIDTFDINGSIMHNLPQRGSSRTLQVVLRGDDGIVHANLQPFSLDPFRIPPFKSRQLEITILGNVNVRSLHMATTMEELLAT